MKPIVGNKRWGIVLLLSLCYTVLYMDRSNMSMAGPSLMKHYNWSATEFGLASTAFFIGYAITQIPGGRLADRFGGGKVVLTGALVWSVFVFITPFGSTMTLMIIIRALMGLGEGISLPAIHSILAKWIPKDKIGKATGFVQVGVPFGIAITMPIATWIIQKWGWEMVFHTFAFLGPVWCLIWWKFGKDKPELHPKISKQELDYIQANQGSVLEIGEEKLLTKKRFCQIVLCGYVQFHIFVLTISFSCL